MTTATTASIRRPESGRRTAPLFAVVTLAVGLTAGFFGLGPTPAAGHGDGTNGCTAVPDAGYLFDFHEACDQHDRCYIAQPYGSSETARARCDSEFRDDMIDSCRARWPRFWQFGQRSGCYGVAGLYFVGVRLLGGFGWSNEAGTVIR